VPLLPQQKHLPLTLDLKPRHDGEERSLTAPCRIVALSGDGTAALLLFDSVPLGFSDDAPRAVAFKLCDRGSFKQLNIIPAATCSKRNKSPCLSDSLTIHPSCCPPVTSHCSQRLSPGTSRRDVRSSSFRGQCIGYWWWTRCHRHKFSFKHFAFPLHSLFYRCSVFILLRIRAMNCGAVGDRRCVRYRDRLTAPCDSSQRNRSGAAAGHSAAVRPSPFLATSVIKLRWTQNNFGAYALCHDGEWLLWR